MAILFTDGFDSYGTTTGTNILTRWTTVTTPGSISSAVTPYGYGQSFSIASSTNIAVASITATTTFTFGCAVYLSSVSALAGATSFGVFEVLSSGTSQLFIHFLSNGTIQVTRAASTVIATSTVPGRIKSGNWYYIEFSATISDTVGTVRVDVDGETVINATGLDTRNGTPTNINQIRLGSNGDNAAKYFDDIYVSDSIIPLGPQRIYTLRPNVDTAQKQWIPLSGANNYTMVGETVTDGDTSYVSGSTVGDFDLYDLGNYPAATANIKAINHLVWARKTDATVRTITSTTKSGATTTDSSAFTLGTTYAGFSKIYEADPNTSTAWTVSGVNALQVGQKVAS